MDLRLPLLVTLSAVAAPATPLAAQDPVIHQTYRSGGDLDLELRYKATPWNKGDKTKARMVGELRSRTPLTVGGKRVEGGAHRLTLSMNGGQPQLVIGAQRDEKAKVTLKLSGKRSGGPERVSLALQPGDDAAAASLFVGFAATHASLEIGPAPRRGADDPALAQTRKFIEGLKIDRNDSDWKMKLKMPPKLTFTSGKNYIWNLRTNVGLISIRLMPKIAPMHCSSTIFLAEVGFYDDILFHRIIPRFMAQAGCPMGNGRGSPGYQYDGEFKPEIAHDRPGTLSMANRGPGTDGSQFFLTFGPTRHLDGKHTIFGRLVEGQDAMEKLEAAGTRGGQPTQHISIEESYITVE